MQILKRFFKPQLSRDEVFELQELNRSVNLLMFWVEVAKGNTLMLSDNHGKFIKNLEGLHQATLNTRNTWIHKKLDELGYSEGDNVNINLRTGKIQ